MASRKLLFHTLVFASILMMFGSCLDQKNSSKTFSTIYSPQFAKGFEVISNQKDNFLVLINPSGNGDNDTVLIDSTKNLICFSASHAAFMDAINHIDKIKAVDKCSFYANPRIKKRCTKGEIKAIGGVSNFNPEILVNYRNSLISISGFDKLPQWSELALRSNVQVIRIWEWKETNPLARAEWIVAFGYLFGNQDRAKHYFQKEVKEYKELLKQSGKKQQTSLFSGNAYQGTWYCPGGNSFMGQLFNEAGFNYAFKSTQNVGSISLTSEAAISTLKNNDVWIYHGICTSWSCLLDAAPKLELIDAQVKKNTWSPSLHLNPDGSNLFWEQSVVSPTLLLEDLVKIANNDSLNLNFYQKVK